MSRSATRTFQSAVRAWPSSSMVSATTAAPCSRDQRHDPGEPRPGAVAVLEVHRVDRRSARRAAPGRPRAPAARSSRASTGSVDAVPSRDGQLAHVGDAVAADVVDAHVEQVGAVAGLAAWRCRRSRPSRSAEHGLAEGLGAVGVGALADRQVGGVLPERHARRTATTPPARGSGARGAGGRGRRRRSASRREVLGGGAAAAADEAEAELAERTAPSVVQRTPPASAGSGRRRGRARGRPALGMQTSGDRGVPGQVPQVLAHLGRAGGAVQADRVDAERAPARSGRRRSRVPSSIVPVVSTVTWTKTGRSTPGRRAGPLRAPMTAALACSRSWQVSTRKRVAPRRRSSPRPGARRRRAARRSRCGRGWAAWCRDRSSRARSAGGPGC